MAENRFSGEVTDTSQRKKSELASLPGVDHTTVIGLTMVRRGFTAKRYCTVVKSNTGTISKIKSYS